MAPYSIEELRMIVSPIAQAHGVESVSLFGSYSNGTADAHSDVDLKIEKGALRSLFQICGFRLAVEDALKLPVDLVTSESSDKSFLDMIKRAEQNSWKELPPSKANGNQKSLGHLKGAKTTAR